jgi:hypothetical protein
LPEIKVLNEKICLIMEEELITLQSIPVHSGIYWGSCYAVFSYLCIYFVDLCSSFFFLPLHCLYGQRLEFRRFYVTCTSRISTMRKTCHKKKLTLLNEIYWRKITYLYVGLSTKISICIFQLYLTIFSTLSDPSMIKLMKLKRYMPTTRISSTLVFRRFYVTRTFLHYDVTSSLHKSWENPCYPKPCIWTVCGQTTGPIVTKLLWNDPWMAPFQIVSGDPDFQPRWPPNSI